MLNTIAISTDMESLYLIDNGKAITFSLLEGRGIIIGLLEGQLTVASAVRTPRLEEELEHPVDTRDSASMRTEATEKDRRLKIVRLSTEKTVWTTAFDLRTAALCFIGATEVEVRRPGSEEEALQYKPSVEFFELRNETVHLRRFRDYIIAIGQPLPKKQ